jgi:GT2 family glycosyltransferase
MNDDRGSLEQFGSFAVEREVSGVTAACAMIPKAVFEEAGGFSMLLPLNFNDVDLCMKVNALGYQIYWTPNAELYHYESKTRVSRVTDYEIAVAWERWDWKLDDSRFWPYQASNLEFRSTRPRVHRD